MHGAVSGLLAGTITGILSAAGYAGLIGLMPLSPAAGAYSCITHYLKAVTAMTPDKAKASGRATVATMKAMPVDDALYGRNVIRGDGRLLNPMYLFQVKTPAESKYRWDYLKVVHSVPGDQAFAPMLPQCDFSHT